MARLQMRLSGQRKRGFVVNGLRRSAQAHHTAKLLRKPYSMGQRIRKILGTVLQIVCASALIGIVVFAVMVFPWFRPSSPKIDQVTHDKAIFVLNWGKIDRFPEEVLQKEDSGRGVWLIPPIDDALLVEALKTASMMAQSDNLVWFPSEELWCPFHACSVE